MKHIDFSKVLSRFQRNWTEVLSPLSIEKACCLHGLIWRRRLLDPVRTIQLFFLQVLHGNTSCTHLRHLSRLDFSASAYCQARMRLPLAVFESLLQWLVSGIEDEERGENRWRGHRVLIMDGSTFSMPDTPDLGSYFGYPATKSKKGCFPVAHMLAVIHAGTGMILRVLSSPVFTHDMSRMSEVHPELSENDVVVLDRGFCSFGHISLLIQRKVFCVMRVHQRQIVKFRPGRKFAKPSNPKKRMPRSRWVKRLGVKDQLVEWYRPRSKNLWMSPQQYGALPPSIVVRELRYCLNRKGFRSKEITLVTTLLSVDKYPAEVLAELYRLRWSIETNFRHLKITMRMDILRSKTVDGILKELSVFYIIYNLIRLVMLDAAKKQEVSINRISFIDAIRWLMAALTSPTMFLLIVNPDRTPRQKRGRNKTYPNLKKPRQSTGTFIKFQQLATLS